MDVNILIFGENRISAFENRIECGQVANWAGKGYVVDKKGKNLFFGFVTDQRVGLSMV